MVWTSIESAAFSCHPAFLLCQESNGWVPDRHKGFCIPVVVTPKKLKRKFITNPISLILNTCPRNFQFWGHQPSSLRKSGFFFGRCFHRILAGFGDPLGGKLLDVWLGSSQFPEITKILNQGPDPLHAIDMWWCRGPRGPESFRCFFQHLNWLGSIHQHLGWFKCISSNQDGFPYAPCFLLPPGILEFAWRKIMISRWLFDHTTFFFAKICKMPPYLGITPANVP